MSTRTTVFISLLAWAVFLLFGSGNTQFLSSPADTAPTSPPQLVPVQGNYHLDADSILQQAQERASQCEWLFTRIKQRRIRGDFLWTSDSTLQRGPNGCCRLETDMGYKKGLPRKVTVVSDGRVVARITPGTAAKPKIESWPLSKDLAEREISFDRFGCSGPAKSIEQARARGSSWVAVPALVDDRPGVAITGQFAPNSTESVTPKAIRLFLDAENLWVYRMEWWTDLPGQDGLLIHEVEYLSPRINQPLSIDECQRVFSYQLES